MKSQRRTIEQARQLRREPTPLEATLWKILRDKQLEHYESRRQYPLLPYVADFACVAKKMIIELDSRVQDLTVERDHHRNTVLQEQGGHVLRFSKPQLMREREGIVRTILHHLEHSS